jgi:hypothetical protein
MQVALLDVTTAVKPPPSFAPNGAITSDTGQIVWEAESVSPRFSVNAPAFRFAAGALKNQKLELGDITLEVGDVARDYACISLVALDEKPIAQSHAILLAVAGRVENANMGWNARRTSVGERWGNGPTRAEFVPLSVYLPGENWHAFSLDGSGAKIGRISATPTQGKTRVKLGGYRSLWYVLTQSD